MVISHEYESKLFFIGVCILCGLGSVSMYHHLLRQKWQVDLELESSFTDTIRGSSSYGTF